MPELIEAAARAGQFTTTQAALTRLQTLGNGAHSDRGLGLVALATALISAGPVAAEEFERSIDHLQRTRVAIMLARPHLLYGEWRRRARQRAAAHQELTLAHETFEAIGARSFVERARGGLRSSEPAGPTHYPGQRAPTDQQGTHHRAAGCGLAP